MSKLFFDIETIPCEDDAKEIYIANKQKKLAEPMTAEQIQELYLESSFDGTFGRVCCIAYIKEDKNTFTKGVFKGDEKALLQQFWNISKDVYQFIGHNVFDFDFPFVFKRSIIHNVKPRFDLNFARYRSQPIFDTMHEWNKWSHKNHTSLDTLAKIFKYPTSKDEMDGSQVWPAFQEGRIDDICTYCMKDVELTRKVYYRMLVEPIPDTTEQPTLTDIPF